ncbi:YitT family protein [Brevibacterium litoralis]|uniref:YitT family protein n=1 Tax=Brevibacterium litoralis TaxID=3138935 RepID=UPI0032EE6C4C
MSAPVTETVESVRIPHTALEDALGLVTGIVVTSLGLYLVKAVGAVTGGTAGLSLAISYAAPLSFEVLFILVNLPFFALALWKKGWVFTVKSLGCVVAASALTGLQSWALPLDQVNTLYGVLAGNLLIGVGLLVLFRHGGSMGGFNIFAIIVQEKSGVRAGYVQMGLDVAVVLSSFFLASPLMVLLSALGAAVLNIVLAFNHRPGRYIA